MVDTKRKDTRKGDRHRPGYWVEYGRKRRAKEREAKRRPKPTASEGEG